MDILYLCNGKRCAGVACEGARLNDIETPPLYYNHKKQARLVSPCQHVLDVNYAKNGPIKGPIDLIKRFRIHLRPHFYLEEKE